MGQGLEIVNEELLIAVHCYRGDQALVEKLLPFHLAHGAPVIILSPSDSPVKIPGINCHSAGKRAYIGADSWERQRAHLELLLATYPHKYFLLHDSDSFLLGAELPARLYADAEDTLWGNIVIEPRPHPSPYPKWAVQPPMFLTRDTARRMLDAPEEPLHGVTPYLDYWWLATACRAAITVRPFSLLEHPTTGPVFTGTDSWQQLDYRIRHMGARFMHPIKEDWQIELCQKAYEERDR